MRILNIFPSVAATGPTNVAINIIKGQIESGLDSHVVFFWGDHEANETFINKNCKSVTRVGKLKLRSVIKVIKQISILKPDIVHTHCMAPDILGALASRLIGFKLISTLHCNLSEDYGSTYIDNELKRIIYPKIHKLALKYANQVASVSAAAQKSINSGNSVIIYNGTGADIQLSKNNESKSAEINLIYIGRLTARKNISFLINAIKNNKSHKKIKLHIYGEGKEHSNLIKMASPSKNIFFHGHVENPVYNATKLHNPILVSASTSEGMPMAVLEALSMGIPAVISSISSHSEIKEKIGLGVSLFSCQDSFKMSLDQIILNNTNNEMADNIIANHDKYFSLSAMNNKYHQIYLKLLS